MPVAHAALAITAWCCYSSLPIRLLLAATAACCCCRCSSLLSLPGSLPCPSLSLRNSPTRCNINPHIYTRSLDHPLVPPAGDLSPSCPSSKLARPGRASFCRCCPSTLPGPAHCQLPTQYLTIASTTSTAPAPTGSAPRPHSTCA
ncbi:hypothetical protein BKA66DRAFT_307675 [Pyrenochaeta sp. MPI-SDFR-AT-0127]|nr:hypothetical protein BKA66DRAFT_307675 [Pyrenochaeta sp. MPI-SDFR-AT-0127]